MERFTLFDVFFLPKSFYRRLGATKAIIAAAVLLVGLVDIMSPLTDCIPELVEYFAEAGYARGLFSVIVQIVIAGVIDVFFFAIPVFAVLNHFNRENEITGRPETFIRLIGIYAITHLIVIPVNELIYYFASGLDPQSSSAVLMLVAIYYYFIMRFWFAGVITRGINVVYGFNTMRSKNLVFLLVFFWNMLLGEALVFITNRFISGIMF